MTTIVLIRENSAAGPPSYRAVAGDVQGEGTSAGQALDALMAQLGDAEQPALMVFRQTRPDQWFTAEQCRRLEVLMARWRNARESGRPLPADQQAELDALVQAELEAAARRSAALARQQAP